MPTSTAGKKDQEAGTSRSGALSRPQTIALIQQNKWWPFDRVDGKLLVRLNKQHQRNNPEKVEEAPW